MNCLCSLSDKPTIDNITGVPYTTCEGGLVSLSCIASGKPTPYVAWLNETGTVIQNSTAFSYWISNVTRKDKGNYTCVASSEAGKDVKSGILQIHCEFTITAIVILAVRLLLQQGITFCYKHFTRLFL